MSDLASTCDVIIIGSGPAGCTAALYTARAGLSTIMLSPTQLSGMAARAPIVGNWPGDVEPLPGEELVRRMRTQALNAGAQHLLQSVAGVYFAEEVHTVFAGPDEHRAPAVIIATGAMAPSTRVPGEEQFQGRGVCYCAACDGPLYAGQDVLVVGDDAQATEEALSLAGTARSVCLVCPGGEPRAEDELRRALDSAGNLTVRSGLRLQQVLGADCVTGARFSRGDDTVDLPADGVFLYLRGAAPATEFLMGAADVDDGGFILTDELCRTSVQGVYAAGDVRAKSVRQMVVASAEGATAALAAEGQLRHRDGVRLDRGHKTH